ncbi:MAG: molybdenum cofactor guanylyltransferase [Dehalococcoidia bacterium]|nr:MAG: molybdenum cofactor guanylyltransferase [Dehalococcoidia bacterium]
MTSIVLAGGKSLRLGREKALEEIGGRSLIERVIERLSLLGNEIIVVTSSSDQLPDLGVKRVIDSYPGKGNLVGIYSGLKEVASSHSLVVGCDMPFLNIDLLRYIMELSPGFDVVIPRVDEGVEPLHAVYSKNCLAPIEVYLREGRLKIFDLLPELKVRYVDNAEIERFDPRHLSFFNINSEANLEWARILLEREAP